MSLLATLAKARTEEDVKDAYIAALGLRDYSKGLVDIGTDKVWFEAKDSPTPPLVMFAQLLVYVRAARLRGEPIPPFLSAIDREKGAILPTGAALPALDDPTIDWPASGSAAGRELAAQLAPYIGGRFTTYPVAGFADEFREAITAAIRDGEIIRTPITPDNLRQVFDKWVAMVGAELEVANQADYATLFFADIMHDGVRSAYASVGAQLGMFDGRPAFSLRGASGFLSVTDVRAYDNFWAIYERPPAENHRRWLLERRDSLLPRHMAGLTFSAEAQAVLDAGRALWTRYHATSFPKRIRDEFRLNRPDAGWYQTRRALKAFGGTELTEFDLFDAGYGALGAKLRPMVYDLGFMPR